MAEFNNIIQHLNPWDNNHANNFNQRFDALLLNDNYLYNKISKIAIQNITNRPPLQNDDEASGYEINSLWHDLSNGNTYICTSNEERSAQWALIASIGIEVDVDVFYALPGISSQVRLRCKIDTNQCDKIEIRRKSTPWTYEDTKLSGESVAIITSLDEYSTEDWIYDNNLVNNNLYYYKAIPMKNGRADMREGKNESCAKAGGLYLEYKFNLKDSSGLYMSNTNVTDKKLIGMNETLVEAFMGNNLVFSNSARDNGLTLQTNTYITGATIAMIIKRNTNLKASINAHRAIYQVNMPFDIISDIMSNYSTITTNPKDMILDQIGEYYLIVFKYGGNSSTVWLNNVESASAHKHDTFTSWGGYGSYNRMGIYAHPIVYLRAYNRNLTEQDRQGLFDEFNIYNKLYKQGLSK